MSKHNNRHRTIKQRCLVCTRRIAKGKVLRVGLERFGPFCKKCYEKMIPDVAFLWNFPEAEFPLRYQLWCDEFGSNTSVEVTTTYAEYRESLMNGKKGLEQQGIRVKLVKATVQEVINVCQEIGVPCNSKGCTIAVMLIGCRQLSE